MHVNDCSPYNSKWTLIYVLQQKHVSCLQKVARIELRNLSMEQPCAPEFRHLCPHSCNLFVWVGRWGGCVLTTIFAKLFRLSYAQKLICKRKFLSAEIQTWDCWLRSASATPVLCRSHTQILIRALFVVKREREIEVENLCPHKLPRFMTNN